MNEENHNYTLVRAGKEHLIPPPKITKQKPHDVEIECYYCNCTNKVKSDKVIYKEEEAYYRPEYSKTNPLEKRKYWYAVLVCPNCGKRNCWSKADMNSDDVFGNIEMMYSINKSWW